ncbi:hypothetical protein [Winogradskyella vidalii]|uniref:hypothetical protein n=1 Tax=Winogradskyella vidalii TaxID=2615024 RepID=UPI0015C85632|nr:hypothetical protein [Winogradskyella vidalii]
MKNSKPFSVKNKVDNTTQKLGSLFLLMLSCVFFFGVNLISAQEKEVESQDEYKPFSMSAHIKNMHTWHGFVVHPGAIFATSLEYNSRNSKLTLGLWGGAGLTNIDVVNINTGDNVSANYQEVSIYAKYRISDNVFVEAVSHNNFTGVEERGDKLRYWSYDRDQGYNFVDLNFGLNVSKNTALYLATILGGGSGDYEIKANGELENSWTHYFEIKSKVWEKDDYKLALFVGGAWSFITDKTFYTEAQGNIINVGASLNDKINLGKLKIPAEVTAMWNPEKQKTVLQLDITIF